MKYNNIIPFFKGIKIRFSLFFQLSIAFTRPVAAAAWSYGTLLQQQQQQHLPTKRN